MDPHGSTLFASIHNFVSNVRDLFTADDFNSRHLQIMDPKFAIYVRVQMRRIATFNMFKFIDFFIAFSICKITDSVVNVL